MGYLKEWWSGQKWRETLAIQLGLVILVVNLSVLTVCFAFQYLGVKNILLEKDGDDIIGRFEQSEHNIDNFVEQVEVVSSRLSIDNNLKKLADSTGVSDINQIHYASQILTSFAEMQSDYPYLKIINYYAEDGTILKSGKESGYGNYLLRDGNKDDWYYSSDILGSIGVNSQKMKWYGGISDSEFGVRINTGEVDNYYVSAARRVMYGFGTLVISVDMDYFLDIFYPNDEGNFEKIYIIDENNKIVAAKNREEIGEKRWFHDGEGIYKGIYKYIEDGEQGKKQVIVYYLSSMGWSLVSETPIAEVTKESRYLRNILMISCLISVILSFAISMWWVQRTLKPLKQLDAEMQKLGDGQLGSVLENFPRNELGAINRRFNQMSLELKEMFLENQNIEKEKRELEMRTLRAQINPHLIYNVLNSIKWRAIFSNERNIAKSVSLLADFLKPVFNNQNLMCTVEEELNYVKNYIAIMNLLRTGAYSLEIAVSEKYYQYQMLRFLLQPVVENSIMHGHSEETAGQIRIFMRTEGEDAIICVEDDGCGMKEERLAEIRRKLETSEQQQGSGIGIVNVNRRIKNQYGENYGLTICNGKEKGTVVILRIRLELTKS